MKQETPVRYGKLVKALQIASFAFMLVMLVLCVVFLSKNHISVKTADQLTQYLTGGELTVALILIGFSVAKSFALVFPPAVLFVLSGLVFDSFWKAVLVNAAATALSLRAERFCRGACVQGRRFSAVRSEQSALRGHEHPVPQLLFCFKSRHAGAERSLDAGRLQGRSEQSALVPLCASGTGVRCACGGWNERL